MESWYRGICTARKAPERFALLNEFDGRRQRACRLSAVLLPCALALGACASPPLPESADLPVIFTDVAAASGLDFVHVDGFSGEYYYVETFGSGAAFVDVNGDGWQDVYLVNGAFLVGQTDSAAAADPPINRLYRNDQATFSDVTEHSGTGDGGYGTGCAVADYDNDGDQDIYVTSFGANLLLQNDGDGGFADVTKRAGVGDRRWGTGAGFLDYDSDGDLDLMAVNYVDFHIFNNVVCEKGKHRSYCEPDEYEPVGDVLYRNDGESFTDVTEAAGVSLLGRSLGLALSDFDADGDTDAYVANDGTMNFLYENRQGEFAEVGLYAGGRYNADGLAEAGMGVDFGDIDNDGALDLYVTNFSNQTNTLYANTGRGEFRDVTARVGLAHTSLRPLGFGTKFLDYDNDRFLDLFVVNGHVMDIVAEVDPDQSYAQANQMMRNTGGRFDDVSAALGAGLEVVDVSRGAAVADYDNDGDPDILITNVAAPPTLLRNDGGNRQHWLQVELVGARHRDALGTRVACTTADGTRQVRERQSGSSYLSSHDHRLHFGLGSAIAADLEIRWPDGSVQAISGVQADQVLRIEQQAASTSSSAH